jgi:hypothetical protein
MSPFLKSNRLEGGSVAGLPSMRLFAAQSIDTYRIFPVACHAGQRPQAFQAAGFSFGIVSSCFCWVGLELYHEDGDFNSLWSGECSSLGTGWGERIFIGYPIHIRHRISEL